MNSLKLNSVSKQFGSIKAVSEVSISLLPGELFFLLGPSGCGKTTLLRIIAGLETPDSGEVFFGEKEWTSIPSHKRNIGMVFQNYALWPHMSVFDNVAYGLRQRGVSQIEIRSRVALALQKIDLASFASRKPTTLSGGQQQRVALARALVYEPEIILFDEPLSNLDAKLRVELRQDIQKLHEQLGITMVYVTHDQEEVHALAQRAALMINGKIIQTGKPHTLFSQPCTIESATFFGHANLFSATVSTITNNSLSISFCGMELFAEVQKNNFSIGDTVNFLIKEECITISTSVISKQTGIATVIRTNNNNQTQRLQLTYNNITFWVLALKNGTEYSNGSSVHFHIPQDAIWILPETK